MSESFEMDKLHMNVPHMARIYDYWLGGTDNFEVDRSAAKRGLELVPEFRDYARGNRHFLIRAVRFLRDKGIRQFLDIGAGVPASPNVHDIALAGHPDARVVYVDNDPLVSIRAEALIGKDAAVSIVREDLRDHRAVLARAEETLDFTEPVGLLLVACLHHVEDRDDPAAIAAEYLGSVAGGSYLALSHFTHDFAFERVSLAAEEARGFFPRGRDAIEEMFNGRPLVDPGLVTVSRWRPDGSNPGYDPARVWAYGGVARL
jgi:SAM-dependent methyltransferase